MAEGQNFKKELIGNFGYPVWENPTEAMVEAAFAHHGMKYRYVTTEVKEEGLKAAFEGVKAMGYKGFNSTIPHKVAIIQDVDTWNIYKAPKANKAEQVYCLFPAADADGNSHFLLLNAKGDKGVSFYFPHEQLPYMTQWKNENSLKNGYVTGLEPGTGFPHNRSIERKYGRVPVLQAGKSRTITLTYRVLDTEAEIQRAKTDLQDKFKEKVEAIPDVIGK